MATDPLAPEKQSRRNAGPDLLPGDTLSADIRPGEDMPHEASPQDARYRLTGLAIFAERTLPELLPAAGVVALFLILSWISAFESLEPLWRMALGLALAALFIAFCMPLRKLRYPGRSEIERRLDRTSPSFHRPLATLSDELAESGAGKRDEVAVALWQAHRQRAEIARAALQAEPADIPTRRKDRFALRAAVLLALVASAFVAGDDRGARLARAVDWSTPRIPPIPPRLDAWIDPPSYTGRPPIFLSSTAALAPGEVIRAPVGSTLTIRSTMPRVEGKAAAVEAAPARLELQHGAGLEIIPEMPKEAGKEAGKETPKATVKTAVAPSGVTLEKRIIRADGAVRVRRDGRDVATYTLAVIPDLPPKAILEEVKIEAASTQRQTQGGIRVVYALEDDYGIAKAELIIEHARAPAGGKPARTLFPPPSISIPLRLGAGEAILPTEDHPWAGEEVRVRLKVEDDIGQSAESEARTIALPQRPFTQAVAKALVEQRRDLNISPDDIASVRLAFDALLFEPERYTAKVGDFLALDMLRARLRHARKNNAPDDDRLREISDQIYDLALFIENGDMTDAEKRLREAEARLREALEREASPEEIKRLAEELRRAMDQFLREFAERALRDPDRNAQDRTPISPERMLTQRDLADMLRKIEEMARSGNTAEAQKLLNQLKQVLENLRTARRQNVDPKMRELGQQLEELDRLQREQRDLRDRTFREGQQRGQRQQGQRGQQRDGQQSQDGEQSLQDQQQALQDRLKRLRERLQQRGMQEGEGLGDAEQGMGDAEGQLGQGNPGEATEGQGRALDGLGRAAQGMARDLQRQMGEGEGEGEGLGEPGQTQRGRAENGMDPLGRPLSSQRRDFEDRSKLPGEGLGDVQGSISERAERVLRELRKRLGEFERPREELDYLERLLRQR